MTGVFQLPTTVHFGSGVTATLAERIAALGVERVFVVTDPGVRAAGIVDRVLAPLVEDLVPVRIFDAVHPNPRDHECRAAADEALAFGAEVVVAIGGGSPIDAAKAVAALATNGGAVRDWEFPRRLDVAPLPLVAIPTTAGTGSEVTFYAVVTDTARHFKMSLLDVRLAPEIALVDPDLTLSLPPAITAATGMDALTHAVEAYTGKVASPVTDALALHAIRLIARHLRRAVGEGGDVDAREGMMMASLIAGMAFGNADVGAVHCLAEAIGGLYDTPHGVANSVFLPFVFALDAEAAPERHADVAEALGVARGSQPATTVAAEGALALRDLARAVGIPAMSALPGIDPVDFERVAAASARNVSNPSNCREMTEADYLHLLRRAWANE